MERDLFVRRKSYIETGEIFFGRGKKMLKADNENSLASYAVDAQNKNYEFLEKRFISGSFI